MSFLLLRLHVRVQHPDRYHGKRNDQDAMPALHAGFALGQDTFDLPICETDIVDSVLKNANKVTLYCQGGFECENRLENGHVCAGCSAGRTGTL